MNTQRKPSCKNTNFPRKLSEPQIIGYMSVDVNREYHDDLSQLKFLNRTSTEVHLDLNHRIHEAIKRTTDDNDEYINLLLKFLLTHGHNLNINNSFVSYRRSFINIMCNVYHNKHVRLMAGLFNGSIYLCDLVTPEEKLYRETHNRHEDKFSAWGYKFEQYLLSDLPNLPPDINRPVIENEEFSNCYHATLGEHNLVYGAQIDGLLVTNKTVPLPSSPDYETNLHYLRNNLFVELKTNRELEGHRQERSFKKFKMMRSWCQCYLAGLKGLLVGYRDDNGVIKRLERFNTNDIVQYCRHEWEPELAIQFLDYFLHYVKNCFKNHPRASKSNEKPVSLIFDVHGSDSIEVSECSDKQNNDILPEWYVQARINKTS